MLLQNKKTNVLLNLSGSSNENEDLGQNGESRHPAFKRKYVSMPLTAIHDFKQFEIQCSKHNSHYLVRKKIEAIRAIGGEDLKCTIRNAWKKVMDDGLMAQFL